MTRVFSPERKKVIFFDLNGTLVRNKRSFSTCFREVLDEFSGRWDKGAAGLDKDKIYSTYRKAWRNQRGPGQARKQTEIRRRASLGAALKPFPITVNDGFTKQFFKRLKQLQSSQSEMLPGVPETLESLSKQYQIAMISNGSKERQAAILKRWNLSRYFPEHHLFSSQNHMAGKPHPAIFRDALAQMGITSSQAVMVGDSLKNDIYGATRVGIDAVWIHPSGKKQAVRKIGREKIITLRKFNQLMRIF